MLYDAPYGDSLDTYCKLNGIIDVIIYGNIGWALVYKYCIGQKSNSCHIGAFHPLRQYLLPFDVM